MSSQEITLMPVSDGVQKWVPIVGDCATKYLAGLSLEPETLERLEHESVGILGNCHDPNSDSPYSEAGLVLGFVQSGKTQSFTTVAALARDNGFGMVIVLAGVSNLLKSQSIERLIDDLGLKRYSKHWKDFENPGISANGKFSSEGQKVKERIQSWNENHDRPSLLITILKQGTRIDNLQRLLSGSDLSDMPVLIIDDESDQATPNTRAKENLSAEAKEAFEDEKSSRIHNSVKELRATLPKHTYLQYTATPQANLLAAKSDVLSPEFARILTPGDDYVGGLKLFSGDGLASHVRIIPETETINPNTMPDEVPPSLLEALRSFWLGCSIQLYIQNHLDLEPTTKSMMIQVSQKTLPHNTFYVWANANKNHWKKILKNPAAGSYKELIEEFKITHTDLSTTLSDIPAFDELISYLVDALDETNIIIVNSTQDAVNKVEWHKDPFWILIGGMKLDRGFTVRGITTTYMPRALTQNADTLQQRARFFGYHLKYLGLIRIYLSSSTRDAFIKYVEHETAIRNSLVAYQGKPLRDWKRKFILDPIFRNATRPSVVGIKSVKTVLRNSWATPKYLHSDLAGIEQNSLVFDKFVKIWGETNSSNAHVLPETWVDKRVDSAKHVLLRNVSLRNVGEFLSEMCFAHQKDSSRFLFLQICLQNALDRDPTAAADIILINNLDQTTLKARRLGLESGLENIFIGRNPKGASISELTYAGDDKIFTENTTIHLRYALIEDPNSNKKRYVPWIAIKPSAEITTAIMEEAE